MESDRNLIVRIAHRTNRWATGSATRLKFLAKGLLHECLYLPDYLSEICHARTSLSLRLLARVRGSLSPPWHWAVAIQAIAATLVLAGVLMLFVLSVRASAANALDFLSSKLDESRQVVLEGNLIYRDCRLEKEYGYHAMCPLTEHHGWLQTSDGRLWGILDGNASQGLIHNSTLLGPRVKVQGRIFPKAGSIAVSGYELL